MRLISPLLLLFWLAYLPLDAQDIAPCGTKITPQQRKLLSKFQPEPDGKSSFRTQSTLRKVAVSAHLIHRDDGSGGLTNVELEDAMQIVNSYYSQANLQFFLAVVQDINSSEFYDYNTSQEVSLGLTYDIPNTINIYFAGKVTDDDAGGLCGYAYFPGGPDRVLMDYTCAKNGSTLTHELGHYLALFHTHGKGDGLTDELVDGSNCSQAGDEVCDTPADPKLSFSNVNSNCEYTGTTVDANDDPFDPDPANIMSYSRKNCRNHLSEGQYFRASEAFKMLRTYLYDRKVVAGITSNGQEPCVGSAVAFESTSLNATSWQWKFEGGVPSKSTEEHPSVVYESAGTYDAELIIQGENGEQDTLLLKDYITVVLDNPTELISIIEDFESNDSKPKIINADEQMTFTVNSQVASSGEKCLMIGFYDYANVGQEDYLILPDIDNTFSSTYQFSFDYAYTYYDETYFDGLSVVYRASCDVDWSVLWSKEGQELATVAPVDVAFVPTDTDWKSVTLDLTIPAQVQKFEIAFRSRNGYGNNLYLDNISLQPLVPVQSTDYSCLDANDGVIEMVPNGSRSYTFSIDGKSFLASPLFTGLSKGVYNVMVKDELGRIHTEQVLINGPNLHVETTDISCFGSNNGGIKVKIVDGVGNYQFFIDDQQLSGPSATNLSAGDHVLMVQSLQGNCSVERNIQIKEPPELLLEVIAEDATCYGGDGLVTVSSSGGVKPYDLTLSPGGSISGQQVDLPEGNYELAVRDANDCVSKVAFQIGQPDSLYMQYTSEGFLCEESPEGVLEILPKGGVGAYDVYFEEERLQNSQVSLTGVGEYFVRVVDGGGCEYSETIKLDYQYKALEVPEISLVDGHLLIKNTDAQVTWYQDGEVIEGAVSFSIPYDSPGVYQVRLSYGSGNCEVYSEQFVILSVNDPLLDQIGAVPNPYASSFELQIPELLENSVQKISMYDLSGSSFDYSQRNQLKSGVYLIIIEGETFQKVLRVIKNH